MIAVIVGGSSLRIVFNVSGKVTLIVVGSFEVNWPLTDVSSVIICRSERTPPCMVAQTVMAKNRNNIFFINNKLIIDLVNVSH